MELEQKAGMLQNSAAEFQKMQETWQREGTAQPLDAVYVVLLDLRTLPCCLTYNSTLYYLLLAHTSSNSGSDLIFIGKIMISSKAWVKDRALDEFIERFKLNCN